MFVIAKRFEFAASHVLEGLPEHHKCGRLHGHNYGVEIIIAAPDLDDHGFVVDYGDLAGFRSYIDRSLDHRHLNDVLIANPTAENLAIWLFEIGEGIVRGLAGDRAKVIAVRVSETPNTWAEYRQEVTF